MYMYIYIHTHVFTSIYLCIYLQYFQLCSLRSDKPTLEHPCVLKYTRTPLTKCRIFHCQSSKIGFKTLFSPLNFTLNCSIEYWGNQKLFWKLLFKSTQGAKLTNNVPSLPYVSVEIETNQLKSSNYFRSGNRHQLPFYLSFYLAYYLAFYLPCCLTYSVSYYLAFYLTTYTIVFDIYSDIHCARIWGLGSAPNPTISWGYI